MKKYFGIVLFLIVTVICLSGCFYDLVIPESDLNSEDTENGVVPGKGTLKIYLTDASGNYKENDSGTYSAVYITISKIEAHIAGDNDGDNDGDKGSWEELKKWDEGLLVNLKELEDRSILLALLELEPNKYTQLRLFLMGEEGDAWLILNDLDLTEEPLEIPSVYQTGIKLNRPFEIVADGITKLTIDFDAEKSVIKTGNGKYKMKPVIHVISETPSEEDIDIGSVSGTVFYYNSQNPNLEPVISAIIILSGGEYIFLYNTSTDGYGTFIFDNVPVGNCVLNVYADGFDDYSESIVVEDGEDTVVDIILLFEEPGAISGSVIDSENGLINAATVTATLSSSAYTFEKFIVTGEDGLFFMDQLPVGTYTLNVSAMGYIDHTEVGIGVTAGETTNGIDIVLVPVS